jgi:hypothetical protein
LDFNGAIIQVASGIQIEVDGMVSKVCETVTASGVALGIRRSHVGWDISKDVSEGHFVVDDLLVEGGWDKRSQVLVRPGVGCDLMTLGFHTLDQGGPLCGSINGALAQVVSGDEESGLDIVDGKFVQEIRGVGVWSVVESQGNVSSDGAIVDSRSTVLDISILGAGDAGGGASRGHLVSIAVWSIIEQAIWGGAVFGGGSTPS